MITSSTGSGNEPLIQIIHQIIRRNPQQRITFERFMELALYHPTEGYYTRHSGLIGARGDFYTAPHLSPVFGELVGKQIAEFWQRLGQPEKFQIVEFGAGQGLMSGDIMAYIYTNETQLWPALSYTLVEISGALQRAQRHRLEAVPHGTEFISKIQWCGLDEINDNEISGCIVSNELLDSFPVHLITVESGKLHEIYVRLGEDGKFIEEYGPLSKPAIAGYFKDLNINLSDYANGYRTEVNLRALSWVEAVARILTEGFVLTIDYGYPAAQRYNPRRTAGTLQCYSQHRVHDNPYLEVGWQDITSHVDFTTLIRRGEELGMRTEGFTRQALFLAGLGLGSRLSALSQPAYREQAGLTIKQQLAEHEALQRLINPAGLGGFGVLIQSKNVPPGQAALAGLKLLLDK